MEDGNRVVELIRAQEQARIHADNMARMKSKTGSTISPVCDTVLKSTSDAAKKGETCGCDCGLCVSTWLTITLGEDVDSNVQFVPPGDEPQPMYMFAVDFKSDECREHISVLVRDLGNLLDGEVTEVDAISLLETVQGAYNPKGKIVAPDLERNVYPLVRGKLREMKPEASGKVIYECLTHVMLAFGLEVTYTPRRTDDKTLNGECA